MRFSVIIATRGKPEQARTVAGACLMMASGEHEVEIVISCDDDDPATIWYFHDATNGGFPVVVNDAPRPPGITECWNRCIPGAVERGADVIIALPDDGLMSCPNWDAHIARYMATSDTRLGAMAMYDSANEGQATILLAHRHWIELAGFFDSRFYAWWADTAINETFSFVTGRGLPIVGPPGIMTKQGNWNPRLTEMKRWWNFYSASRRERLKVAEMIRAKLGLPTPDLKTIVAQWEEHDRMGLIGGEDIVRSLKNPKPKDEAYFKAEAVINDYMLDPIKNADEYVASGKWRILPESV